jgi:hypothetical protein
MGGRSEAIGAATGAATLASPSWHLVCRAGCRPAARWPVVDASAWAWLASATATVCDGRR